ncbi:MAG: LamG domain-containing protein [Phycisphaerae bacterium]|nr:LamG domain-containing protein [Phycisphaerae bacterium]
MRTPPRYLDHHLLVLLPALVCFLVGANHAAADLNDGLVGYWSFDEGEGATAYDYSGHGNHGTLHNATWVSGIAGSALEFDPDSGYVEVPDSVSLNIHGNTQITLMAWLYKNAPDLHGGSQPWYSYPIIKSGPWMGDPITCSRYALHEGNDNWLGLHLSEVNHPYQTLGYPYEAGLIGRWTHLAGTWDGSTMWLYVNGAEVASKTYTGNLGDTAGRSLKISCGYPFNGIIDEVRIYDRALSEDEIRQLYEWTPRPEPQEDTTDGDQSEVSGTDGDPVNTATGNFAHQETDLSIPSRGSPLIFTRFYNSKAAAPGRRSAKSNRTSETGSKPATSQPASRKDGQRSSVDVKKNDESPRSTDQVRAVEKDSERQSLGADRQHESPVSKYQEQAAGSSQARAEAKEKSK